MAQPEHSSSKRQAQHFIPLGVKKATEKLKAEANLSCLVFIRSQACNYLGNRRKYFPHVLSHVLQGKQGNAALLSIPL